VAEDLARLVAQGEGLLVFCGDRVSAEGYESLQQAALAGEDLGPVRGGRPALASGPLERKHSIFRPFNDPGTETCGA
jgi:hypothetical protein